MLIINQYFIYPLHSYQILFYSSFIYLPIKILFILPSFTNQYVNRHIYQSIFYSPFEYLAKKTLLILDKFTNILFICHIFTNHLPLSFTQFSIFIFVWRSWTWKIQDSSGIRRKILCYLFVFQSSFTNLYYYFIYFYIYQMNF